MINSKVKLACSITLLMIFQMGAACSMKWGSLPEGHYWGAIALAIAFTFVSFLLIVNINKYLPAAVATCICTGGTFICCQLALLFFFHDPVTLLGWCGIATITGGIILASASN